NPSATSFIALIRGVNVGGKMLSMERLRAALARLGFENVRTYIQSGNVVFQARRRTPESVGKKIETLILEEFDLPVAVLVRTSAEMQRVVRCNPFLAEPGIDETRLYVTFLASAPSRTAIKSLAAIPAGADQLRHAGKEIYLYCP